MKPMGDSFFESPVVDLVPEDLIASDSCCILDLDLVTMSKEDVEFSVAYKLQINSQAVQAHAFAFWFDVQFSNLTNPITLSTSPHC